MTPTWTRGVGGSADLCQVNSVARANDEVEADCWRFTLKGARRPDPRPWAKLLASGDNVKVEKAERTHYLDWENPGRDGKPVKRKWSPSSSQVARAA